MAENTIDNLSIQITANAEQAAKVFDRLASNAGKLKGAASGAADGLDELSQSAQDVANTAGEASDQTGELVPKMRETSSAAKAAGGAAKIAAIGIKAFWSALKWVGSAIKTISIKGFQLGMRGIRAAANGARAALGGLRNAIVGVGKGFVSFIGGRISSFGQRIKGITGAVTGLLKSIGRVAFYRAIRSAIKLVTQAFSEGISNLYQWSLLVDRTFANSMDKLATSAQYLKNSLGAMVSPLINALAPAIDMIVDKLVNAINLVNQFFAALTGQSTYTAAKKVATVWSDAAEDTAKNASKAAKEIRRTILGFDELNVLNGNKNNGTSGGSGANGSNVNYKNMFENRKVESGIADFARRIRAAFNSGDWTAIGSMAADKLTGWINKIDWNGLGAKLGNGLNKIVSAYNGFMDSFDFENFGTKFAASVNSLISTVNWDELGRTLTQKLNAISGMLYGFATTFEWGEAGTKFGEAVNGLLTNINWTTLTNAFTALIKGAVSGMINFVSTFEWGEHGKNFHFAVLKLIKEFPAQEIGTFLTISIRGIFDSLGQTVTDPLVWSGLGTKLANFLNTVFGDKEMWNKVGVTVNGFVGGVLTFGEDFLKSFDATTAGTNIGKALRKIDWAGIAKRIWGSIKLAFRTTGDFVSALLNDGTNDGSSFGTKLGRWISNSVAKIDWKQFGSDLSAGATALFNTLADALRENTKPLEELGGKSRIQKAFGDLFSGVNWGALANSILNAAGQVFTALGQALGEALLSGFEEIVRELLNLIPAPVRKVLGIDTGSKGAGGGGGANREGGTGRKSSGGSFGNAGGGGGYLDPGPVINGVGRIKTAMNDLSDSVSMTRKNVYGSMGGMVTDTETNMNGFVNNIETGKNNAAKVDFTPIGENVPKAIRNGMGQTWWEATSKMNGLMDDLYNKGNNKSFEPIGSNIISGISAGLSNGWDWLTNKVKRLSNGLFNAAKNVLGIHSPSKVFEEGIGKMIDLGIAQGIDNSAEAAMASVSRLGGMLTGELYSFNPQAAVAATMDYGGDGGANQQEQVALMRSMLNEMRTMVNEMRQLNEKDNSIEITTSQYTRAQKRSNMRAGVAVVPIG